MKSEWEESSLGDIISLIIDHRGLTPKKLSGDWSSQGYRALSAKNVKTRQIVHPETIRYVDEEMYHKWMPEEIRYGDILITSEAPFGEIYQWNSEEKIVLSQRLFGVRILPSFDAKYIYHYMTSDNFKSEMHARATGTTVIGLRQPELLKCKIKYPNIYTQNKISSILSAIDDKIELNNAINENLERQAEYIFDSMFPNIMFGNKTIGDYITPKRGKSLLSKNAISGDVPVVAGGLEASTYHNIANTKAPVITISASGANAGFVNLWYVPVWSSDSSFIDSNMTRNVFFWYIVLKKRQKEIFDSQTGSAQPHIYPKNIAIMPIAEINDEQVTSFTKQVTPLFNFIGANTKENEKLAKLRDTLLPKLMSGEIDVSDFNI